MLSDPLTLELVPLLLVLAHHGKYTGETGLWAYYEICSFLNAGATENWDVAQEVPYAYQGNEWVGYDNVGSFKMKIVTTLIEGSFSQ
ncbi:Chitinase-like 5 [Apodemus speciosus]|uniref:Chitinase-like 5 n=1 Tax=Apodemus speciosus TaxID=105296 RepID=A0ABQ0EMH7_APOSI